MVLLNITIQIQCLMQGALNHPLPQAETYSKEGFTLNTSLFRCSLYFYLSIYLSSYLFIIICLLLDTLGKITVTKPSLLASVPPGQSGYRFPRTRISCLWILLGSGAASLLCRQTPTAAGQYWASLRYHLLPF